MLNVRGDQTATDKGIKVGSSKAQLGQAYPGLRPLTGTIEPSFVADDGEYLLVFRVNKESQTVNAMGTVAKGDTTRAGTMANESC